MILGASGARGVRPAQMRSSGWGVDEVDNGLVGALTDWLGRCGISDFLKNTFEVIEVVLMC